MNSLRSALARWATFLAFLAAWGTTAAGEAPRAPGDVPTAETMARQLRERYPGTRIDSVAPAVVPGLFEVVMGRNVAYVEPGGRYFVFGHVWDMQQRRDLTADRLGSIDKVDVASLPLDMALTWRRGSGGRVLHVLADPQCGYCRQLERTLDQLDDATVHLYVLPILGPESRRIAEGVWCSPRREQAWRDWMLQGSRPPAAAAGCNTDGLAAIERAGRSLGVQATPMLISGDGRKRAGALAAADLMAWLDAAPTAGATTTPSAAATTTARTAAAPAAPTIVKANP